MSRLFVLYFLACLVAVVPAQQTRRGAAQKRTTTTKQRTAARQPAKKTTKRSTGKKTTRKSTPKQPAVTVKSLKNEQQQVRRQIKEQERKLRANEADVKKRLQNLLVINNEIADKMKASDTTRHDTNRLDKS